MSMEHEKRRRLTLGRDRYMAGNFREAGTHLRDVLRDCEGYADVHNMLGVIAFQEGDLATARQHFERALELNPGYIEAGLHLSICLNELGLYEEARRRAQGVLPSGNGRGRGNGGGKPAKPAARGEGGDGDKANGAASVAPPVLDAVARARLANLHADLGDCYRALGDPDGAVEQYEHALVAQPHYPDIRCKLGVALRDGGRLDYALAALGELCERHPQYLTGRLELGITLFTLGRVEEARRHWQYVRNEDPEDRRAAFYLAAAGAP